MIEKKLKLLDILKWIFIIMIFVSIISSHKNKNDYEYSDGVFSLLSSSENKIIDSEIKKFAKDNGIDIRIEYDDTLKITKRLNNLEKYDALWLSNSIWMYMIDTNKVKISDTKSTSINPIVLGIKKSKADELGFTSRDVYTQDLVNAVMEGNLKFTMSNPVTTNSGASAYLGVLTTLAGNPEILTQDMLEGEELKGKLKSFLSGVERSSGSEDYLEEAFVKGDYEAIFTYESSIININKELEKNKKDPLYVIYPIDGVSVSDSPIGYIDQKNESKKKQYDKLVSFLLGKKGQKILSDYGRRTWYGGVNPNSDKSVFNPNWGIDTSKYISFVKYPSTSVIRQALLLYQTGLRKPVHVVFCLDYSSSMYGEGYEELVDAMDYLLTDRSAVDMLQFSNEDIIDVIPFASEAEEVWHSNGIEELPNLLNKIKTREPNGITALYPAASKAVELLKDEDRNKYNTSVILMTDGAGNVGTFREFKESYREIDKDIPIYSIMFAAASRDQLENMAELSNGKVFDGRYALVDAFMEVRGYN